MSQGVDAIIEAVAQVSRPLPGATFHLDWVTDDEVCCVSVSDGVARCASAATACPAADLVISSAGGARDDYFLGQVPLVDLWPRLHFRGRIEVLMCASGFFES